MNTSLHPVLAVACATILATSTALSQSVFAGRVLTDSGVAIAGAEVLLNGPQNIQRTNAQGEFRFAQVHAGEHLVGVRMPGFAPKVDTIEVADAGEVRREFRLARIQATLPEVPVTATLLDRKLYEFHERRRYGVGRFMDSTEFAKAPGTRTSDRLSKFPGLLIQRGRGSAVFVTATRTRRRGEPGSNSMCRAMVWLDGVNLGVEFNVNELDPSIIAAVEWYANKSTAPAKLVAMPRPSAYGSGRLEDYCGILVIWLR